MPRRRRKALKFASARKFCDFRAREGSPAARYHEIFEISDFASGLESAKSGAQKFLWSTPAQPKPPAHISQRSDGRISKTIVRIQSSKPKRDENARKFCSPFFCFEAPATTDLLGRWQPTPSLQVMCGAPSRTPPAPNTRSDKASDRDFGDAGPCSLAAAPTTVNPARIQILRTVRIDSIAWLTFTSVRLRF